MMTDKKPEPLKGQKAPKAVKLDKAPAEKAAPAPSVEDRLAALEKHVENIHKTQKANGWS
jgi:hypothetical protein